MDRRGNMTEDALRDESITLKRAKEVLLASVQEMHKAQMTLARLVMEITDDYGEILRRVARLNEAEIELGIRTESTRIARGAALKTMKAQGIELKRKPEPEGMAQWQQEAMAEDAARSLQAKLVRDAADRMAAAATGAQNDYMTDWTAQVVRADLDAAATEKSSEQAAAAPAPRKRGRPKKRA